MTKKGFTLVELSIVLVIIGLLIGGILVAQSMIQTAKVEKVIKDIGQMEIAVNNFKSNYKYYPGDAPQFSPPGNASSSVDNTPPCYGALSGNENYQVFAHLSQANMLDKKYNTFSPTGAFGCPGGTDNGNFFDLSNARLWPVHTDIDTKGLQVHGYSKMPFYPYKPTVDSNFMWVLYLSADQVIPIENKLGSVPFDSGFHSVGVMNETGTKNTCYDINFDIPNCADPTALGGVLYYSMSPI